MAEISTVCLKKQANVHYFYASFLNANVNFKTKMWSNNINLKNKQPRKFWVIFNILTVHLSAEQKNWIKTIWI